MVVYPRVLLKVTFAVQTGWWLDQEPTEQQRNRDNQESMISNPGQFEKQPTSGYKYIW